MVFRLVLLAAWLGLAVRARAEEPPAAGAAVTLADLVQEALAHSPELAQATQRAEALRARVPQAGALPDPTLMTGVVNEGRPVPFETLGTADFSEVYVGLAQTIPFPGKRSLREEVARGDAAAEEWAAATHRRELILDVARSYHELQAARAALGVVERDFGLLEGLARAARQRFAVGEGMQRDALGAQLELSRLEERRSVLDAQQQLLAAALVRLLGRSEGGALGPLAEVAPLPLPASPEEALARAEAAWPMLREQEARVEAAARRLELARTERMPDLGLELVYHSRGRGDLDPFYGLGATVALPVHASRKQERAVEAAAAELRAARSAASAARAELRYAVSAAYTRAQTSERLLRLYDEGLLRQGQLVLDSSLAQYRVGRADFESVISSWRRLLEDGIAERQQRAAREAAAAELAVYVGSPALVPPGAAAGGSRP